MIGDTLTASRRADRLEYIFQGSSVVLKKPRSKVALTLPGKKNLEVRYLLYRGSDPCEIWRMIAVG
jgi:hypothetical protein